MNTRLRYVKFIGLALACLPMIPALVSGSGRPGTSALLSEQPIKREKTAGVIEAKYRECFSKRRGQPVKAWVFFTDKGIDDELSFDRAAAAVSLTDRALKRRAKVGLDRTVFADLSVVSEYVTAIENLGARHRRSSRWLNGASFELPAELIEKISGLDFVAEIRPLAAFARPPEPEAEFRQPAPPQSLTGEYSLDYGDSFWQLEQLNVPAVHENGYSGQGVTLAILDTGCRKSHDAFAQHFAEGRVLAEYDFVHNDGNVDYDEGDAASERSHGTKVWSVAAGCDDGNHYGPAYGASFILCKTEDVRSETNVEEDNWVAALEFADSIGTDVISTSLGYMIFDDSCDCNYTYEDLDGQTATISIAAGLCDGLGIVMCNSAGNSGPEAGTVTPPADAFGILAVGSVNSGGTIYGSSSRGPTYDGRIKPEVCARGVATHAADPSQDFLYNNYYGTSFATPLIAGAACLLIEAHPDWTPYQVREALKASGDRAENPDNTYGWGIIDLYAALQADPGCCQGKVGNVVGSGDGPADIADVTAMIDYLYINFTPIDCLSEADINQSGGIFPHSHNITIGDIALLIDHLFISLSPLPDCL